MYLEDLNFFNKKTFVRVDFNVPLNNYCEVLDDTRIRAALPTLKHILKNGGAVILASHLGRPQKKRQDDGTVNRVKYSLRHIIARLSGLLERPVQFVEDTIGEKVTEQVANLKGGEVLLLENTRFYKEEKEGDEAFARSMADLADIYINDAFGTAHRAHASTCTIAKFFKPKQKAFGFLIRKELENAKRLLENPKRPFTAIVGGAKVSDKIVLLEKMLDMVDTVIVGGGMAYTLIKAQGGSVGNSLVEEDKLELANNLLAKAKEKGVTILLPEDSVVADKFSNDANRKKVPSDKIEEGWMGLDIGPKAVAAFRKVILKSETIFWNGPMGVFEMSNFANGTSKIATAVAKSTTGGTFSLVGGGDSVAALHQSGNADRVSYVSTGGGAMLELLQGSKLPGIEAIGA